MARIQKQKLAKKILSSFLIGLALVASPFVYAQEIPEGNGGTLYNSVEKQIIQLTDEGMQADWNVSELETYGIKFLIRGKEALTWTLNIQDSGFHNPAIEKSYSKVLTIVNSLFILGLLAIAAMWMFSILIPRKYLKKVILVYSLAVIFVNFALPINQLFIDGANLLQKTLLIGKNGEIQITDIVQTPAYAGAISYRNETAGNILTEQKSTTVDLSGDSIDIPVGKISITGQTPSTIALSSDPIQIFTDSKTSVFQEQTIFRFTIMVATALAYFTIALIFVLRIVILWALLILSPVLLILGIFKSTRGWFYNWLGVYGRWLLIGPLTALGIAVIVNIWQLSGLPITVSENYAPEIFSTVKDSNVLFYLPGKDTANTLSNTQEMMEYLIFLIMLYLPIFLAFTLTRRKTLQAGVEMVSKKIFAQNGNGQSITTNNEREIETGESSHSEKERSFVTNLKNLVSEKIGFSTGASKSDHRLRFEPEKPTKMMESASNFLPEHLENTPIPKMLELLGREKGSKQSHNRVIERMANVEKISSAKEAQQVQNILSEIENRAQGNDKEAKAILREIETINGKDAVNFESKAASANNSGITINLNEQKPDDKKKAKDRSENEETGKKNVKKRHRHRHKHKGKKDDKNMKNANPDQNAN